RCRCKPRTRPDTSEKPSKMQVFALDLHRLREVVGPSHATHRPAPFGWEAATLAAGYEVLMPTKSSCGPHTDLSSTDSTRVTRCACGVVHITLLASGVTVRLNSDTFRSVVSSLTAATERLDALPDFSSTGSTSIN